MNNPLSPPQILNREYLELRAKILELAASFDRLQRAREAARDTGGLFASDPRCELLRSGLQTLLEGDGVDRAEQVQLIFSRAYDPQWRTNLGVSAATVDTTGVGQ